MSYLQMIRELKEQHRLVPSGAGSHSAPTVEYELDERDERRGVGRVSRLCALAVPVLRPTTTSGPVTQPDET